VVARHETVQADDYYAALDQMVCGEDLAKWRILRTTTWHALNHPAREFKDLNFPIGTQTQLSGRARRNLEALAALLDEQQPQDRLTKAEVLRELSHFKEALQLLQHPWGTTQQQTAAIITQLATHGDALVREVIFDTRPRKAGR
jgi:hypothetical protein